MNKAGKLRWRERVSLRMESWLLSSVVPSDNVGPVFKVIFRIPLLLKKLGLGFGIPDNVLILTTIGRHTGKLHRTPVEFSAGPEDGVYLVMSGWDGRTDWYKNICANPCVRVWLKGREWEAAAAPVPDADVAKLLKRLAGIEPSSNQMWSRWAGFELDGSDEGYLRAAPHFPSFYLRPA